MKVRYLNSFDKTFNRLPMDKQLEVIEVVDILIAFLETKSRPTKGIGIKKLRKNFWEVRISLKLRILFEIQKGSLIFILVGSHDDIKRYIRKR